VRHNRNLEWQHIVDDLADLSEVEVNQHGPPNCCERLPGLTIQSHLPRAKHHLGHPCSGATTQLRPVTKHDAEAAVGDASPLSRVRDCLVALCRARSDAAETASHNWQF
jgi:hypothetical protein